MIDFVLFLIIELVSLDGKKEKVNFDKFVNGCTFSTDSYYNHRGHSILFISLSCVNYSSSIDINIDFPIGI